MSQIIKNEDGTEIEVFTLEEIEAQKQAALDDYKANNPDRTGELSEAQEKLRLAEELLAKKGDKDQNFNNLRKAKDDAEKKVADILAGVDEKISTVKREVMEGVMKDHYNDTLKTLAGEDEDVKKKIEFNYKRLADTAATKDEITSKLQDAYLLAIKPEGYNALSSTITSSGGVGRLNIKPTANKFSADEKAIGSKFGLSDEDFKKHAK